MNQVLRARFCFTVLAILALNTLWAGNPVPRTVCCLPVFCDEEKSARCSSDCSQGCFLCGITTFIPRSQGANTARELVGWQRELFQPYFLENYATVAITSEYTRSFRSNRIARTLFCTDCLTFAGSNVINNTGTEVVADNFGLSRRFMGTLSIRPRIQNYINDVNLYFGLNEWIPGMYLRLHAPIVHTEWSLGLDECLPCANKSRGDDTFAMCYMASSTAPTAESLREALSGTFLFGDMQTPWHFGRFSFCSLSKTRLADIDFIVGYNIFASDAAHFGIYGQLVVPTGNRPKARYIFEPIAGNGRHWELGIGISGHTMLFDDCYLDGHSFGIYLEGNVTNVFKTHQLRSFDFKLNGLLSRYLLLKEFDVNNNYIHRLINAINFATRNAEVHVGYKTDISLKFAYQFGNVMADIGYNLFAKSGERVCIRTHCPCDIDQRHFGIKGTEPVCNDNVFETVNNNTQPNATIFNTICNTAATNATVQNQEDSADEINLILPNAVTPATQPVLISCRDLDPTSATQCSMLTHKFFAHFGYMWRDYCFRPHVGIGGEAEINGRQRLNSLNQWGVWIKGGVTF